MAVNKKINKTEKKKDMIILKNKIISKDMC